ncbi:transcription factor bHLH154-like [Salvia hispanica]|uniref:transcription factor bHLH154-like n=1 Tax=Salvia hispanica TaxID=49212 RepID=UPI0020093385|nr:transcription factor bHLH154-like [Salvia hispanica]
MNYMPLQEHTFYQPWNSTFLQHSDNNDFRLIQGARKRPAEGVTSSLTKETEREKKRQTRLQGKLPKVHKEKEPTSRRRSQKLTDKITTLQKLVSPYGKTDTASVLLEASVSIQALQDQIKEMFHIISGDQTTKQIGERRSDLQSRGLCLVPSVVLEQLDRQFVPTPSINLFAENH